MPDLYEPPGTGRLYDPIHPWLCPPLHLIVQGLGSRNQGDMNETKWSTITLTQLFRLFIVYFQDRKHTNNILITKYISPPQN